LSLNRHPKETKNIILHGRMMRIFIIMACMLSLECQGQTCCTGGVPYLGIFKIPTISQKQFGFNFSYSLNKNSNLILHDQMVSESMIVRYVNTILLQSDYAFSDLISVSIVLPYIKQNEIVELAANPHQISNCGLGDISIWSTIRSSLGRSSYAISFALKAPNGKTDASDPESGIDYPLSFQTGSGSWDFIFNLYNELPLNAKERFVWINQLSTKINTKGNKFEAHPDYKFGHVLQLYSSLAYNLVIGQYLANAYVGVSYQFRRMDEYHNGYPNDNTGGNWIFTTLGYNHQFSPKLGIGLSGTIPIFAQLNGLQLSTSAQVNVTIGYII